METLIRKSGILSLYIELEDFQGWEAKAAWDWLQEKPQKQPAADAVQPYSHLLLATDFSAFSELAAQRAAEEHGKIKSIKTPD